VSSYVDSFIELKFYPPIPTDEYVDSVPAQVQEKVFNTSNLKAKGYEVRTGFKTLIQAYCNNPGHPAQQELLNGFWQILKGELRKHYREEEAELLVKLKYFPFQPTQEYIDTLPKEVLDSLIDAIEETTGPSSDRNQRAIELLKLMDKHPDVKETFNSILKQKLISYYVEKDLNEEIERLKKALGLE